MLKVDHDLTRVLVLQDKVGIRQSGHFDHDANAMSGPSQNTQSRNATAIEGRKVAVTVRVKLDPASGEYLSV
jgi:hypothetical protein